MSDNNVIPTSQPVEMNPIAAEEMVAKMNDGFVNRWQWFNWPRFPLVPQLKIKQEDKHNTWGFNFHWLMFRVWTGDAPMLGAEIDIDTDFKVRLNLPYVWTAIIIPIAPYGAWTFKFWRKPKGTYDDAG